MGSGIAEVCARASLDVIVKEFDEPAVAVGRGRIESSLARAVHAGKLSGVAREQALGRLRFTTDLESFSDRQFVIEAVVEAQDEKEQVFSVLDKVVEDEDAVLASNTSSIPIMKLAMQTARPEAVIGTHFFNPVPVLSLVEVVTSLVTGPTTVARTERLAEVLHKKVIRSPDRAGFVVNALLVPFILSAIRMLESGFATTADIDTGMVEGCAHPMGPLALADLIGLDTLLAVAQSLYEEFKEPLHAPPPLLLRMVDAGLRGRKSGRGFYEYQR
jgi:3-hydroxybutyryl-CoA dehydrogenase